VVDPEIAKAVEEVDSYIALGFVDDAKDALRDALARFPGQSALVERASSLGLDLSAKPEPAPAPSPKAAAAPAKAPAPPAKAPAPEVRAAAPPAPKAAPEPRPEPPSAENDLLSGLSFDDLPSPPPEPAETAPAVNMRVAEAAPVEESGGIDLGAELSALFDAQPALEEAPIDASRSSSFEDQGLQDVFNEFKKGVDSQLGEGDYDTRYNLGIAYKEMGLVDEAIAEFQLAAKDPKRSLECSSMIGICFMEKGMADVAVQWYERGLQVPGRAPEEYRGLRYDLAIAWEAAGELAKAKATFGDLVREDPSFRDVSDKLRDLQSRA
jgi:tetratricopeptide (TPR) repeat protein